MKKYLIACVLAFVLCSCAKSLVRIKSNLVNKIYRIQKFSNGSKDVAFIGVMHINQPDYYKRIKQDIDSLRASGYTIMYEGIAIDTTMEKEKLEVIQKKLRKIIGIHLTAYLDSTNNDTKKFRVKGMIDQTPENTGLRVDVDIRADLSLDSLIYFYEQNRGPIVLDECDLNTKLGQKYKCGKVDRAKQNYLLLTLRDQYLIDKILKSKSNQIALLYGNRHSLHFLKNLNVADSTWKRVYQ
ncbi:MAG: hypothetical protein IR153_01590 [Flavobacterium sp.]|nr:hypothetical protein [Flavobacterium sp.]